MIRDARKLAHQPIPVDKEGREQYRFTVANVRERLHGAGMSAFVLDEENGYRLDEINELIETIDAVARHLDESRRPQLSDDTASLPQPGADSPGASVEL